ncbi:toxin-antitoxin system YwqK family antitoxin [Pedobacter alpinus]|uniref:Toxin-antitoxin system YwqK family antitoxin n=1 Tax=Pedobacter alpinus TaxID=1590643 RepID=A0ABW5TQ15_9SPHI
MKKFAIIIVLLIIVKTSFSQLAAENYLKKSVDGYVHLYFDEQYYLADQNCEFKYYTRVCKYSPSTNGFDGFFTDYYNNNTIALTGNYKEGKMDGNFKGFYPAGIPKFDAFFDDDQPFGTWSFYYPSGEIWLKIQFVNNIAQIKDFWNVYGVQKVVNGKGKYGFTQEVLNFNEFGYNGINFNGRINNGVPVGNWLTNIVFPNKSIDFIGNEYYKKGVFISSNYIYPAGVSKKESLLQLYPSFNFYNTKKLTYKNCTIDDNQGYNFYLQEYLNNNLPLFWEQANSPKASFKVAVVIDSTGKSLEVSLIDSIAPIQSQLIKQALQDVNYWIPSFIRGKTIKDTVLITISPVEIDNQRKTFAYPIIIRNKED